MTEEMEKPVTEEQPQEAPPTVEQPNIEQPDIAATSEPPATPPETPSDAAPDNDVEEGKAFAILSYALSFIGIPFFLVPLIMRNNAFALYHAKQCLILWLASIALMIISGILTVICIGPILALVGGIAIFVLFIMGLIKAVNGESVPVPLVGKWGEEWFKGIQKI